MMRVAIVDDEISQINITKRFVIEFFQQKEIEYSLYSYSSGEELLESPIEFDIIFLDIQMDGIDGIETAQKFRAENKQTAFFYVTSYSDYIMKSMTIHPFAFIVKPIDKDIIFQNLEDYLAYVESMRSNPAQEYFKVFHDNQWVKLDVSDICYFHYMDNRTIDIITTGKTYQIKDSISRLYETLNHQIFLMPQQSFIINIQHISRVDGKNKALVMKNGDIVLIARRKYYDFFNLLNKLLSC